MTDEHSWIEYRLKKAQALRAHGYFVELPARQQYWMNITQIGQRLMLVPILQASAKIYPEASEFGIDNGRISKLSIRELQLDGKYIEVFGYDRGHYRDELESTTPARALYEKILKELN